MISSSLGFHSYETMQNGPYSGNSDQLKDFFGNPKKGIALLHNIKQIAGYIPVIGAIVGLTRMKKNIGISQTMSKLDEYDYRFSYKSVAFNVARGALETLGLGILYAPVDITATVVRFARR